jgi:hypothetical protein
MAKLIRFADGVGFDIALDHKVKMVWQNGKAYESIKGASSSYVPPHMFAHFVKDKDNKPGHYNMASDYAAMKAANVAVGLAATICIIRASAFSMKDLVLNAAEIILQDTAADETGADQALADFLVKNTAHLKNVMQQSVSILALNGISMVVNGHHYIAEQSMWSRFAAAANWDVTVTGLGLVNWEGPIYHDALHMVDIDYIARKVTDPASDLIGHVNGVVSKRIPAQPSGTLIVSVFLAMLDDVAASNEMVTKFFHAARAPAESLQKRIMAAPLDWCAQFPRKNTAAHLREVDQFAPLAVILFAYLNTVLERKPTSLRSKALKSAAAKNTPHVIMGQQLAERYPVQELNEERFTAMMAAMIAALPVAHDDDGKSEINRNE